MDPLTQLLSGAGNVISGNDSLGMYIRSNSHGNLVQGNYIGTDASGTLDLGNTFDGVAIDSSTNNTMV